MSTKKLFSVKFLLIFCLIFLIQMVNGQKFKSIADTNNIGLIEVKTGHLDLSHPQDEIDSLTRNKIQQDIQRNRQRLIQQGKLVPLNTTSATAAVSFIWPIRLKSGLTDPGFYGISNYIDRNPAYPNQIQDYNCGTRSYDVSSGYNHRGTDIFTWPYGWYKMDSNQVEIIAAAAGIIIGKDDGNYDRSCAMGSSSWNAVYIQHADGSVAWYGHMKNGSLTSKAVGQTVVQGEFLGVVGSSGSSTGPHLHFEVYDSLNNLVDPWNGPCNSTASWWASQQPYYNSQLNKISTHFKPADFRSCPLIESPNESKNFCFGDTIYLTSFYRDQVSGQTVAHKILTPSGTVWNQWTQNITNYYSASWWYYSVAGLNTVGTWKYQITYSGITYETTFNVSSSSAASVTINSSKTTICAGETVSFRANPVNVGTNPTFQWQINNVNVAGATGVTFTTNSLNNGNIVRCIFTSSSACTNPKVATSNQITMNVISTAVPTISISQSSGNNPTCVGQTVTFTALATNAGIAPVYQWQVNGVNAGLNSNVFSSSGLASGSVITCQLTTNQTCASTSNVTSNSITINVNPLPSVSAGTYSNLSTTSSPITLTGSPTGGTFSGIGVSAGTFNPTVSGTGTFTITYSYNNPTTGCTNTGTTTITVLAACNFAVGSAVSGNVNVCGNMGTGDSALFSITATDAVSYAWSVSSPSTMGISAVSNRSSVKIKYATTFTTGTVTVVVTGCNGTTITRTLSISKTVPGTPAAITGAGGATAVTYICPYVGGANLTYVATPPATNASAVIAYRWSLPTGSQLVSVNVADSSSITIKFPSIPSTLSLSVIAISGCGNSAAKSITLNATAPLAPTTITGSVDVCSAIGSASQSGNVSYSIAAVNNAASYLWTVPTGATLISGQGTTSINVVFASTFLSGNITAQSVSPCGNSTAKTLTVYKRVAAAISAVQKQFSPTSVAAVTNVCGLTSETYRIRKVTYATSYNWSIKLGAKATITHVNPLGINDTAVVITFLSGFTVDTLSVSSVTPCSVSAAKVTILSAVYSPPTPTSITSSTGSYNACIGNVTTYTAVVPAPSVTQLAAIKYRWTKPSNTTITSASSDSLSITLQFNTGYTGGSLTVKGQTACGALGTAKSQALTHTACPTGTRNLPVTKSITPYINQQDFNVSLFPNPTSTMFTLSVDRAYSVSSVRVFDLQGRTLQQMKLNPNEKILVGSKLKAGTYLLEVRVGDYVKTVRVVKY